MLTHLPPSVVLELDPAGSCKPLKSEPKKEHGEICMRRPPLSDRRSSRLSLTAPICHHQQHRAAVDAQGAAHCAADKQQSAAGRPPRLASTSTAFAAPSLASGRRSEEPPGRRRCLPAAAIHRRRLGSIDCWHRAARWQVAGTWCFVPRRRRQAAFSDQRRAQSFSIEAWTARCALKNRRGVVAASRPPSLIGGGLDRSIAGIGRRDGKSPGRCASSPAVVGKQRSATNVALSLPQ